MEWIDVNDKLPENFSSILVVGESIRSTALFQDGIFYSDLNLPKSKDITHWMPLPEPPKNK